MLRRDGDIGWDSESKKPGADCLIYRYWKEI